jgi:HSP20 family protein
VTLMRFDPFRELDRLGERVLSGGMRAMPTEAFRRGDTFIVLIDLPGIDANDVQVTVERNVVNVQATRISPRQEGDELLVDERAHGKFSRQFFLGDNLDAGKLTADLERGVLTLTIPVAEQSKPRQVQIGSASARTVGVTQDAEQTQAANQTQAAEQTQAADQQPAHA